MASPTSLRKAGLAVTRRASSAQAAVTLTGGVALAGTLTGTTDGTIADVAAVSTSGGNTYADSAINTAITSVNLQLKELQVLLNKAIADNVLLTTLVNEHRTILINLGASKGAA